MSLEETPQEDTPSPASLTGTVAPPTFAPEYDQIARHLKTLDPAAAKFVFVSLISAESPPGKYEERLYASLDKAWPKLVQWQANRRNIYITINEINGAGRTAKHIVRVRAVWQDQDKPWSGTFPLPPSFEIETSPGNWHRYWFVAKMDFKEHRAVERRIANDFGGDKATIDLARILRLAGTWNFKKGRDPFMARIATPADSPRGAYSEAEIIAAFPPLPKPERQKTPRLPEPERQKIQPLALIGNVSEGEIISAACSATTNTKLALIGNVSEGEICRLRDALGAIPSQDYDIWVRVGMALWHRFEGEMDGCQLWDDWSATASNYEGDEIDKKWPTFKHDDIGSRSPTTIGSLYKLAKQQGWTGVPWQIEESALDVSDGFTPVPLELRAAPAPSAPPPLVDDFESRFTRVALTLDEVRQLPARPWVIYGYGQRGRVTVVSAPGNVGKSQLMLAFAVAVARGDGRAHALDVRDNGPVVLINAEDDYDDIAKRLAAIELTTGIPVGGLPIISYNGHGRRFLIVARSEKSSQTLVHTGDLRALAMYLKKIGAAMVVIDSLAKAHRAKENDNDEMTVVTDAAEWLAREANVAVFLVHHVGKPKKGSPDDIYQARGASAIIDNVRLGAVMTQMSEVEPKFGIAPSDAWQYVRLSNPKANHLPGGRVGQWFKKVSVGVSPTENAPALVPHTFEAPDSAKIEADVLNAIAAADREGNAMPKNASRSGAPQRLSLLLGISLDQAKDAVASLVFANLIKAAGRNKRGKTIQCWVTSTSAFNESNEV